MESLLQDLRYAMRAMVRRPGFTLLAVLTFGLGVAASTAMFSVVDAVLLRPPPFPAPERLVSVYTTWPRSDEGAQRGMFSYPEFKVVRDQSAGVLDGLAILSTTGVVLYDRGEPELIRVGANPEIVGRSFQFGDDLRTVIGVLPASVVLPGYAVDAWRLDNGDDNWGNHHLWAIGRLAAGISMQQASARLSPVLARVAADQNHEHGVQAFLQQSEETRSVSGALWLLTISALVLLLVACGNVAALLNGAAIDREQEFAVRASPTAGPSFQ